MVFQPAPYGGRMTAQDRSVCPLAEPECQMVFLLGDDGFGQSQPPASTLLDLIAATHAGGEAWRFPDPEGPSPSMSLTNPSRGCIRTLPTRKVSGVARTELAALDSLMPT